MKLRVKHNEKSIQRYKSEKNVKQHAATQTHKVQRLHAAVHAHRICDGSGTIVAERVAGLRNIQSQKRKTKRKLRAKHK